jgi:DNA-binding FadR family transcriptional regulator
MKVVHARERAVLARLWIALFKSIQRDYKSFNNDFITLFVGMIVFDRSAEGRKPPTASDIARVTGFSRTTVLRHLQRMQRDGLIHRKNGGYCVTDIVNTPEALRGMQYRLNLVLRAAQEASHAEMTDEKHG